MSRPTQEATQPRQAPQTRAQSPARGSEPRPYAVRDVNEEIAHTVRLPRTRTTVIGMPVSRR